MTQKEQDKIDSLGYEGYVYRDISQNINRSSTVVHNYIKLRTKFGLKVKKCRKWKVTAVLKKQIVPLALTKKLSSSDIKGELLLDESARTIRRILSNSLSLVYKKYKPKPPLTNDH